MQEFKFGYKYDAIFTSWGLGYLTKKESIRFLNECNKNLRKVKQEKKDKTLEMKTGLMFAKETTCKNQNEYIQDQHMWARTVENYNEIFEEAGFEVRW
jgi:hypothetical protein